MTHTDTNLKYRHPIRTPFPMEGRDAMSEKMKAAVKLKPAPKSTEIRPIPTPQPHPDEVLIRVKISSICGTDVHIYDWDAWAAKRIKVPLVQGHEFAGEIAKVGSNVIVNDDALPPELATIQDPLGNAVYTVTNANVPGKIVAIFGLGPIGLMAVALSRAMAARKVIAIGRKDQA